MKLGLRLFAAAVLTLALAAPGQALTITPSTLPQLTGNDPSQAVINAVIGPIIGPATLLYKAEPGSPVAEEGALSGSYNTVFSLTALDPMDATITYVAGRYVGPVSWALVKDGNSTPAWYLFNLTALGWDGTETLNFQGFWPANGAISHVALYGGSAVPDGGSAVMLLGAALVGLAGLRRFMK